MLDDMQKLVNTLVNNAWLILEPNVLDGMDSLFVNTPGSNDKGRVYARFFNGKMTSADYSINNTLYRKVKTAGHEIITEPYWDDLDGKHVQMISICYPIKSDDKFYGVLSIDYDNGCCQGFCYYCDRLQCIH